MKTTLEVFYRRVGPNGRERVLGRVPASGGDGVAGERLIVAELRPRREPWVIAETTLDGALGLAEDVVAGHERAITDPKTTMRLAAALIGLVGAIQSPDAFLAAATEPPAAMAGAAR